MLLISPRGAPGISSEGAPEISPGVTIGIFMRDARGISSGGCWNLSRRSLWNLCGSCFGYLLGSFGIKLPLESPKGAPGNLPRVDPGISPSVLLKTRHNVCSKFDRSCS